ncbi:MAG: phosphatase PAP2 family protein [Sphingosinicella sp.]
MPVALIGLAIAWGVMLLFGAMEFDRALLVFFHAGNAPRLAEAARWLTHLGDGGLLLTLTGFGAGLLLARQQWRSALMLLAITLSGRVLIDLQKDWTARVRPDTPGQLVPIETFAFPSGHAANATMVWLCLALLLPRAPRARLVAVWAAVWAALAAGASRVMLGVHWPSDVIGGWAFGLFWILLVLHVAGIGVDEGTPGAPDHSLLQGEKDEREQANRNGAGA